MRDESKNRCPSRSSEEVLARHRAKPQQPALLSKLVAGWLLALFSMGTIAMLGTDVGHGQEGGEPGHHFLSPGGAPGGGLEPSLDP